MSEEEKVPSSESSAALDPSVKVEPEEIHCGDSSPEPIKVPNRETDEEKSDSKKQPSRIVFGVIACLILSITALALLRDSTPQSFPKMSPGRYLGVIRGTYSAAVPIYVEVAEANNSIFFIVLRVGFLPQTIIPQNQAPSSGSDTAYLPITLEGANSKLKFIGESASGAGYSGLVYELIGGSEGTWELHPVSDSGEAEDASEVADIRLWLLLRGELADVDQKISKVQARIPETESEVLKLTQFITDDRSLKDNAGRKLALEREALSRLRTQLKNQQEEVAKLERQVDLSHRVTAMGKLVSLSRESLEREGRWISSALRVGTGDLAPELEEAAIRGEKILELKRRIEAENAKIYAILNPDKLEKERDSESANDGEVTEKENKGEKKKKKGFWGSLFGGDDDDE